MRTLAFAVTLLAALPALAQSNCGPRDRVLGFLAEKHDEVPVGMGVAANGTLLTITASPSGSWSALVIRGDDTACMVASGEGWQAVEAATPGRGS